jgi:guanine deaminase
MLKAHLDEHGEGRVKPIITPRFVPSCSDKMLRALGEYAAETGLPVQSHLSENRSEIDWVKELEPESTCYGDAYNRYGLFGQTPTLMAHCCYTDGEEMELMRRNGVYVVHCPMSNSNLSSGMAPIRKFLNEGIHVALGTDVSAGHHMSMLRVMQYAIQVSKLNYAQTRGEMTFLSLSEVFYLATKGGGSFFGKVGSFERGYAFDALVIDDTYLNFDNYTLEQRLERFVYLGDDRDIRRRFCCGVELKEPAL